MAISGAMLFNWGMTRPAIGLSELHAHSVTNGHSHMSAQQKAMAMLPMGMSMHAATNRGTLDGQEHEIDRE